MAAFAALFVSLMARSIGYEALDDELYLPIQ